MVRLIIIVLASFLMSCGTYQITDYERQNLELTQDRYKYNLIKKDKKPFEWFIERNEGEMDNVYYSGVLIRFGK